MRILLIPPKNNYPDPAPDVNTFGQGIPYLAGALREAGHEVFGMNISHIWCHGSAPLTLEKYLRTAIAEHQPHLIGVGGLAPDYFFVRDVILFSRTIAPEIPIVCGGGLVTYDPHFALSHLRPDFAIVGEGEISIVKLLECLQRGESVDSVPGLVHQKNDDIVMNQVEFPANLDELPFPEYDPFDFDTYLSSPNHTNNFIAHTRHRPRIMPLSMARSCPYKCTFCCHSDGTEYRSRSIASVMQEIASFYEKYHFNILYLHDELGFIKPKKALEFCTEIRTLKQNLRADFDWGCYLRVDTVSRDLLAEMKAAGCKFIGYGLESASAAVLRSMKKGTTPEQMVKALQWTQEAGIGIHGNFIFGDVAETPETIGETIDFYNTYCKDLTVYFYYITPYPGSELFDYCLDKHLITDRQDYYETVAPYKGSVNMTGLPDEVFYDLTEPVMHDIFNAKKATLLSLQENGLAGSDRNAPFELRRASYRIEAVCPHCSTKVGFSYPLRLRRGKLAQPFIHYCTSCHKKLLLDVSEYASNLPAQEDPYLRLYTQRPYTMYYPFNSLTYATQSVPTPHLLESYKDYNIIRYGTSVLAVAHVLGEIDIAQLAEEQFFEYQSSGTCLIGNSVEDVKSLLDKGRFPVSVRSPELIGSYKSFNLIHYNGQIYAIHRDAGEVDIATELMRIQEDLRTSGRSFIADSPEQVKRFIDEGEY